MIDPLATATAFFNDYLIIWGKNIIIALFFLLPLQDPLGTQGAMQDGSPTLPSHHGRHLNSAVLRQIATETHPNSDNSTS